MDKPTSSKVILPKPTIREFPNVNRFYDKSRGMPAAKILPGEFYVTQDNENIMTVLGSCVSACIRDPVMGIGGMNHFMLPHGGRETGNASVNITDAARYGNYAMEHLINTIMKYGGRRQHLEIKIFGGGRIINNMVNIGERNIDFVIRYLQTEGMTIIAQDVGDIYPRKVVYHPLSGKVFVKKMRSLHNDTIQARERLYLKTIDRQPVSGDVELFD